MADQTGLLQFKKIVMAVWIPWIFCGAGTLFCLTGIWLFYRTVYEKEEGIIGPVLLLAGGVILIGIGTAKYFYL